MTDVQKPDDTVDEAPDLALPKKKKKKKTLDLAEPEPEVKPEPEEPELEGDEAEPELALPTKKKIKKKKKAPEAAENMAVLVNEDDEWTYEQLLGRAFQIMRAENPSAESGTTVIHLEAPSLVRVSTKKVGIVNFKELCDSMRRPTAHVLSFLLAELGTTGTFAADNRLTLKGRFQNKHIENVLRHYVTTYVMCLNCKSPDTELQKENRLTFVKCHKCHSRRSVAAVDKGFQAIVGKRRNLKKD